MWYIFPQLRGLGRTYNSNYYGISNVEEAKEYLANELLNYHMNTLLNILLDSKECDAAVIFGDLDAVKLRSSTQEQMCIARYTLAVDRRGKDAGTDFPSVVAFGKAGEFAEKYLHKGTKIVLTGRIQTGSYTNRDGVKVYTTDIVAEDQEFAESKAAALLPHCHRGL